MINLTDWRKELKQLKLKYLQKTAPGFFQASGGFSMSVKAYCDKTSNGLTRSIVDFLTFQGWHATRVTAQGQMRRVNGEMKWTKGSTRKGTADLLCSIDGRYTAIEVKAGSDRMRPDQHAEKVRVESTGGDYVVAANMPQFLEWYYQRGENGTRHIEDPALQKNGRLTNSDSLSRTPINN